MSAFLAVLRREVLSYFHAPIAYVVGVAFLALHGLSFWSLMESLSDPRVRTVPGAVLRGFFGGTMLHWLVVFAVVALLSMRSVSEDRRNGIWEVTLTTRVSLPSVLLAKWCAMLVFYALLWGSTVGLVVVLSHYLPAGRSIDTGPVIASYIGVVGIGGALLAVGLAFSAATENQIIAAVATFSVLLAWLILGELGALGVSLNLREALQLATRGSLRLDLGVLVVGALVLGLAIANVGALRGRKPIGPALTTAALLLVIFGSGLRLASRHNLSVDLSEQHSNTLDDATLRVLNELREPLSIGIVRPQEAAFDPVYEEVGLLLKRMQAEQPRLAISEVDSILDPEGVARWAHDLALRPEDLASGGAVIVSRGQRRRSVDLLEMAAFSADDLGVGGLSGFRAEAALRVAIAQVDAQHQDVVCSSSGHGELLASEPADGLSLPRGWSLSANRLREDGVLVRELRELNSESLSGCDALLLLGLQELLAADEFLALQSYWQSGAGVLVALRSSPNVGSALPPRVGLALLLEEAGMRVEDAVVVDPSLAMDTGAAWMTYQGYGEHPIVADFQDRRATLWSSPWALRPLSPNVIPLVQASSKGWGETNRGAVYRANLYEKGADDLEERSVALASQEADGGARFVLLGSAESFSDLWAKRGIGGNERLLVAATRWLIGRDLHARRSQGDSKRPERVRLLMSREQLDHAFVWCVLVGPVFLSLIGMGLWWWRRREVLL